MKNTCKISNTGKEDKRIEVELKGKKIRLDDYDTGVPCEPNDPPPHRICSEMYDPECKNGTWHCIYTGPG